MSRQTSREMFRCSPSLTSLQQGLVKTGGRLVKHAAYYWLLLEESQSATTPVRGNAAANLGEPLQAG